MPYYLEKHPITLPFGFHIITDLVRWNEMQRDLLIPPLSKQAKLRLQWMDYYRKTANAALTCRHFGISRKTFYYWLKRYNPYNPKTLEDRSRAPQRTRQPEITPTQELRVILLRKKYLRYSKIKLAVIYERLYGERISSWKIQRVIQKHSLYFRPAKKERTQYRRLKAKKKKRITELKKEKRTGFLLCCDGIVIYWNKWRIYWTEKLRHEIPIS